MTDRGYLNNSLAALRASLTAQHKQAAARYKRLEKSGHPCADDQLLYCDVLWRLTLQVAKEQSSLLGRV